MVTTAVIYLICMCVLSFSGFLRFSELVNLRRSDIQIFDDYLTLNVQKSKTDRYKKGTTVYISGTGQITCPIMITKRYLEKANISACSDEFIFRSVCFCKSSQSYILKGHKSLSYTRAREILLSTLESIGLDKRQFGLHSLRAGGATAAANAGICDRLFKKHGRWRSESAKDGYVKENLEQHLIVTKHIGIKGWVVYIIDNFLLSLLSKSVAFAHASLSYKLCVCVLFYK